MYSSKLTLSHLALVAAMGLICGCGQQTFKIQPASSSNIKIKGVVDDWSTHHVHFSNPGTEAHAIRNGTYDKWLRITSNPRYQMQQLQRGAPWQGRFHPATNFTPAIRRDWAYQIAPSGDGAYVGTFPAEYGNDTPNCSDYIVFPVNQNGSTTQANIVGFDNLYDGECPSSAPAGQSFAPSVAFAYYVDAGKLWNSPVLSEDGTKVAFVAYSSSTITFHVITLGTTGDNGTAYNSPVKPCTVNGAQSCATNNAVDTSFTISDYPFSNASSSPFVDYSGDIAYIGDFDGVLHKVTGVFRGNPTEVTGENSGWPFSVNSGFGNGMISPVYDSVSNHIFVTSSTGNLYCIDLSSGAPAFCSTPYVGVATSGYILEGPTVDSTAGTVFAEGDYYDSANGLYSSTVTQVNTGLGNFVQAPMGANFSIPLSGDFDNTYYSGNYADAYLYTCASRFGYYEAPTLYRIGFDSSGKMNSTTDGNSLPLSSYQGSFCTPLTEAYNPGQSKDYLFLGVAFSASPSGCNGGGCVMSFDLDDASSQHASTFPTGPAATLPIGSGGYSSGIIIDNFSAEPGASQIYFSNNYTGSATQASQNGLN